MAHQNKHIDDCLPGSRHGTVMVGFDRESESLEDAVTSAVENIKSAGYKIRHVTIGADSVESMASVT